MSQNIVQQQRENFNFAYSLLMQFIDVCPDDLWGKKFGGWPVWQQVYHALTALDFFVAAPDAKPIHGFVPQDVANLSVQGQEPLSKNQLKEFASLAKTGADKYLDSLTDVDLTTKAQGASMRMK